MAALNAGPARALAAAGATAATDVTGFSFAGHALEMAEHSGVGLRVETERLPLLPGALEYSEKGMVPGGTLRNQTTYKGRVEGLEQLDPAFALLLFDAQTSGGLLATLPVEAGPTVLDELAALGVDARVVGEVIEGQGLHLC
jgi:selenide,water dikinase